MHILTKPNYAYLYLLHYYNIHIFSVRTLFAPTLDIVFCKLSLHFSTKKRISLMFLKKFFTECSRPLPAYYTIINGIKTSSSVIPACTDANLDDFSSYLNSLLDIAIETKSPISDLKYL